MNINNDSPPLKKSVKLNNSVDLLKRLENLSELPTTNSLSHLLGEASSSSETSSSFSSETFEKKYPYFLSTESSSEGTEMNNILSLDFLREMFPNISE